ncbi:MAG TPA: GNAT family N-acetyltransferase, partial [Candidatus Limnocylindrales bacterium]
MRPIRDDELTAYVDAVSTGFLDRPDVAGIANDVRRHWDLGRVWAAFEGDRIVGTFRSFAGRLTVPGCSELPAASVTGVTVAPTHRRRGILGRLVAAEHAAARDRGEAIAILFATEYPIYGRFGYGPATTAASWTIRTHQTEIVAAPDDDGQIE